MACWRSSGWSLRCPLRAPSGHGSPTCSTTASSPASSSPNSSCASAGSRAAMPASPASCGASVRWGRRSGATSCAERRFDCRRRWGIMRRRIAPHGLPVNQHVETVSLPRSFPRRWGQRALNMVQFAWTMVWTAACISAALAVHAMTGGRRRAPLRMASWLWAPGLLAFAGRVEVEGAGRVDWSRPYVLVANHESVIDIAVLFRAVPVPLHFLLKQEMTRMPFVNWYARAMGMVFIPRDDRRAATASLRRSADAVRSGAVLCIFPEGTRSRDGKLGPFKPGAFQTAIEAGAQVVPVALEGTGAVLPPDRLFRARPGPMRVRFGAPLALEVDGQKQSRQALAARAQAAVEALLRARRG